MNNRKTIVIVGAGIAGMSAGIYAEQNGFHAIILEKNPRVGGLCAGWMRKGQPIDGCVHWLTGTREGTILYEDWKNVGVITSNDQIINLPSWGSFEYQGKKVTFWADTKRAEKEWIEVAPEDTKEIRKFFKMVNDFTTVELPLRRPLEFLSFKDTMKLGFSVLKVFPSYIKPMKLNCEQYAKRFKNPTVRWALSHAQPGDGNLFSMVYSYATIVEGNGGIPMGGSQAMSERMRDRFLDLGGSIRMNADVDHIIVKKNKAVGVYLSNGEKVYGDYIVTAVDPNYVTNRLLYGQYQIKELEKRFADPTRCPAPTCCLLSYEVTDIPEFNVPCSFECEPFDVAGREIDHLTIRSYAFDKTFVKGNKTTLGVLIDQYSINYNYWKELYKDQDAYKARKIELANQVESRIVKQFPELEGKIKILDVATPKTFNRYTNASRGAYMAFLYTRHGSRFAHNGKLRGLKNLYLSGQWFQAPGGLPLALVQGKFAIQRICRKENMSMLFKGQYAALKKKYNKN